MDIVQSLAAVADALPIEINSLTLNDKGAVVIRRPPPSDYTFEVEGVLFHVALRPSNGYTHCSMWAELGHIPFSLESKERRQAVLAILADARTLEHVRFIVRDGRIVLSAGTDVHGQMTPPALMHELLRYLQEARPYLRLLAEYL